MTKLPKDMDEFVKVAKAASVKVAGTISKLCDSYVAKVGCQADTAEATQTSQQESPKAN